MKINFFDCNCAFGKSGRPPLRYASTPAELIAEMDFCGIDEAFVYHANQRFASPVTWNAVLSAEIRNYSRLHGVWAILPPSTGETPESEILLQVLHKNSIRALRAFPQEHHYRLNRATLGYLYEFMVKHRIPLLVKENLWQMKELLDECPDLIVVAMNQGPHSVERYLRPLMDQFPNLHVETSAYMIDGLIEEFCERYGPERLLFGSGFPDNCSGAALLCLTRADIGPEARAAIAGGNLRQILNGVKI
jgi:predicted TIM-barrel fold metal-dependent hydrolase